MTLAYEDGILFVLTTCEDVIWIVMLPSMVCLETALGIADTFNGRLLAVSLVPVTADRSEWCVESLLPELERDIKLWLAVLVQDWVIGTDTLGLDDKPVYVLVNGEVRTATTEDRVSSVCDKLETCVSAPLALPRIDV